MPCELCGKPTRQIDPPILFSREDGSDVLICDACEKHMDALRDSSSESEIEKSADYLWKLLPIDGDKEVNDFMESILDYEVVTPPEIKDPPKDRKASIQQAELESKYGMYIVVTFKVFAYVFAGALGLAVMILLGATLDNYLLSFILGTVAFGVSIFFSMVGIKLYENIARIGINTDRMALALETQSKKQNSRKTAK